MKQQNELAKDSDNKVFKALMQKSPQTWSELLASLKPVGMSTRTLRKALMRLERKGLVYRKIETTGKYPPPVLYGLTQQGREAIIPIVFAIASHNYMVGFHPESWNVTADKLQLILKNEFESMPAKERLQIIARRYFARALFSLLQTLKTGNPAWFENAQVNLSPELLTQIGLFQSAHGKAQYVSEYGGNTILKLDFIYQLSNSIDAFEKALAEAFPEEYEALKKIYEECIKHE